MRNYQFLALALIMLSLCACQSVKVSEQIKGVWVLSAVQFQYGTGNIEDDESYGSIAIGDKLWFREDETFGLIRDAKDVLGAFEVTPDGKSVNINFGAQELLFYIRRLDDEKLVLEQGFNDIYILKLERSEE